MKSARYKKFSDEIYMPMIEERKSFKAKLKVEKPLLEFVERAP